MKVLKTIVLGLLVILTPLCFVSCKKSNPDVKVDFSKLSEIVDCTDELTSWSGVNVRSLSASRNTNFKSKKEIVDGEEKLDYLHEKGEDKIYCDDNVEYYFENNKKFMNEEFDYTVVIDNILKDCMPSIFDFFNDENNYEKLIYSRVSENNNIIIYEFKLWINKSENKSLSAKFTYDANKDLISIEVVVCVDDKEELNSVIVPNEDIINTPEWFDSNDYKMQMSYEEVKEIVLDENLFYGWRSAHVNVPKIMGNEKDIYMCQTSTSESYIYYSNIKDYQGDKDANVYYSKGREYVYIDNTPYTITEYSTANRNFQNDINELSSTMFQFFFYDDNDNGAMYVNAKKYEKNRTVISFKFEHEYDGQVLIGSLYYNPQNVFYYVDIYFSYLKGNQREEMHFCFERLFVKLDTPEWFNEDDFGQVVPAHQVETIFTHEGISNWKSYVYSASVEMQGSTILSDGLHFSEKAIVCENNGNLSYLLETFASDEANNNVLESDLESGGYVFAKKGTYTFWTNMRYDTESVYCVDNKTYTYKDGVVTEKNSYSNFNPTFYNSIIKNILSMLCNGSFVGAFEVSAKNLTNAMVKNNTNLPLPGESITYSHATKKTINDLDVYTLRYVAKNSKSSFIDYSIYLDENGDLQKIEFVSNMIAVVQGGVTISIEKNHVALDSPNWYNK